MSSWKKYFNRFLLENTCYLGCNVYSLAYFSIYPNIQQKLDALWPVDFYNQTKKRLIKDQSLWLASFYSPLQVNLKTLISYEHFDISLIKPCIVHRSLWDGRGRWELARWQRQKRKRGWKRTWTTLTSALTNRRRSELTVSTKICDFLAIQPSSLKWPWFQQVKMRNFSDRGGFQTCRGHPLHTTDSVCF